MPVEIKTIAVIGLGYIGLPTAAVLASKKIRVIGVDINQEAVDIINRGDIHIVEPDLDVAVHAAVVGGYLRATVKAEQAEAFIIAVPTPFKGDHEPDLSFIKSACTAIAPVLKIGDLVVLESTSPVGTTDQLAEWLAVLRPDLSFPQDAGGDSDIRIAYCPERVLPGHVLRELVQNDRVIGGMTTQCSQAAVELYSIFVEGECIVTNSKTAEMCKLTENSFRDVNIAFANELSLICDDVGVNVWDLITLANHHPRVNILQPGPGVGGHCIAVDPWFIVSKSPKLARIIRTAREVNDYKPHWVLDKIRLSIDEVLNSGRKTNREDIVVACFGLSFKADIDDLRESPALMVAQNILSIHPGRVLAVEPNLCISDDLGVVGLELVTSEYALQSADIAILLVDHKPFKCLSAEAYEKVRVVDFRGIWGGTV